MAEEPRGFLGRWARRKTDVLNGKPLDEQDVKQPAVASVVPAVNPVAHVQDDAAGLRSAVEPDSPVLSLEDVKLLTKDSDFKPFMLQNVGNDVRNAAMKKLFADPHFNIMDGLDIYIDDYSKSDPIPEAMLRQMSSSKFLKLFDDEEETEKPPGEETNNPTDQSVAQSNEPTDVAATDATPQINFSQPESLPEGIDTLASQKDHDYPDLRLQPDHAAPAPKAG